jgi:biopolymer transport protein ExbB
MSTKRRVVLVMLCAALLAPITAGVLQPAAAVAQDQGADDPGTAGQGEKKTDSLLVWLVKVSGIIGAFIFLISVFFVAIVVQQFLQVRFSVVAPPEILQQCDELIAEGKVRDVFRVVQGDSSFFSRSLAAGLSEIDYGVNEAREKLERTAEAITIDMEKKVSVLATIGTLGPMIGLLGTLKGMISSFSVIAISGTNLEASAVAKGISEALVLTFEGVLLSIPAIYFYAHFRNRIAKLAAETTILADDYFRAIVRVMRSRSPQKPKP